jgi:hypothetical protein
LLRQSISQRFVVFSVRFHQQMTMTTLVTAAARSTIKTAAARRAAVVARPQQRRTFLDWMTNYPDKVRKNKETLWLYRAVVALCSLTQFINTTYILHYIFFLFLIISHPV